MNLAAAEVQRTSRSMRRAPSPHLAPDGHQLARKGSTNLSRRRADDLFSIVHTWCGRECARRVRIVLPAWFDAMIAPGGPFRVLMDREDIVVATRVGTTPDIDVRPQATACANAPE